MIRERFSRLPIRHKLVAMIMSTCTVVLLLASATYVWLDFRRAQADMVADLAALATVIVENSSGALLYDDVENAEATLASLKSNPQVRLACLYKADGRLFARYESNALSPCPAASRDDSYEFTSNRLHLVVNPVILGDRIGTLYLRSDLLPLYQRLRAQGLAVGLLLVVALGVALVLSARLQAFVSAPLTDLSATAARISSEGDYAIRAVRTSEDELGVLVDGFNRVLERIQQREEELSQANDGLRREIAERQRGEQERAELLVREREANRLKDEFLATLSHELRTPLNAILGWTRLLRTNAVPPSGLDRALEKVERNAQVQARLVEDLLEVSRVASGKLRLEIRPLDLVALTNIAIDSIRPTAEARGILIERNFSGPMGTAGDPDRLQQVIWNLLSNAVKFTPAGGTVTVTLARVGTEDLLRVTDTGNGIEPAFLPNVFETFRQADASSTRAHGGLGLGLSIVRSLVEMHGGRVTAHSEGLHRGSTFIVSLPVRRLGPTVAMAPESGEIDRRLAGVRMVVVEDDEDARELLVAMFEAAGAAVLAAASAEAGLALCLEEQPDALLSDIGMPGQDGYTLMRSLRAALGSGAPRAAVALTAFASDRDRELSAEAGFDRHVAKPFDPPALVRLLADLLASRRAPREGVS